MGKYRVLWKYAELLYMNLRVKDSLLEKVTFRLRP